MALSVLRVIWRTPDEECGKCWITAHEQHCLQLSLCAWLVTPKTRLVRSVATQHQVCRLHFQDS